MFSLFRKKEKAPQGEADALVDDLVAGVEKEKYLYNLEKQAAFVKIQAVSLEMQRQVVLRIIHWLRASGHEMLQRNSWWQMSRALSALLDRKLPFTEADLLELLDWSCAQRANYYRDLPQIIKIIERYSKETPLSEKLKTKIQGLAAVVEKSSHSTKEQRQAQRLRAAAGQVEKELPLLPGEAWADAARFEIRRLPVDEQSAWVDLLHQCLMATGSAPSGKWLKEASAKIRLLGEVDFKAALLRWFTLADKPPDPPRVRINPWEPDPNVVFQPVNADLLKGLVWLSSMLAPDPELVRALSSLALSTYRKLPGYGPRAVKVGNACIWALGNMTGMDGLAQLSILKIKLRQNRAQAMLTSALEAAGKRNGLSTDEIGELCVPAYGLETVGERRDELGEVSCELHVDGLNVEQTWRRADGKRLAAAPKAVQEDFADELSEIKQAVKDLRKMLPAQRDRVENLYLTQQKWPFSTWQERYLDHPLVGTLARRLIWKFSLGDRAGSGIWHEGQIVGRDGQPLDWLNAETTVELWHPIHVSPEVVLQWRQWLVDHQIQQPFKQAHREVYILTDAEVATRVYSNRFAGHVLKQHQFNGLCQARGWKNSLRLMVDAEVPPPTRLLPSWGLRAEFWVESCGDTYGTDTNDTGTFLYIATDQVRFYPIGESQNYAHVIGGGYHTRRWTAGEPAQPTVLENIPPIVFSEIMRDVDLFVGVASVGNDPNWLDGGEQGRYVDYWHSFSFGALSETAKTRKAVLETLLPRLKISARCSLRDKFLVVRGDIRTYKIHLGSGNILMEPNDRYLCIVPSRGDLSSGERIFLPFEGDSTLAVILSKAFLLAEDKKITDPTIVRQLR